MVWQENEDNNQQWSSDVGNKSDTVLLDDDNVDARIQSLQNELLKLQQTRKVTV